MTDKKPAVCIATNRPDNFYDWFNAWSEEFTREGACVIVMFDTQDDRETAKVVEWVKQRSPSCLVFDHNIVATELGAKRWIIPQGTSACKSFAIYKAWQIGYDPIMVLDDDCYPDGDKWLSNHSRILKNKSQNDVWSTLDGNLRPRGMPYIPAKPIALSHGLWTENLDIDATTELASYACKASYRSSVVPIGCLFPMSGMNLAFRAEIAPLMYFGLHGKAWGVDRFDDIWAGFLAKKVLDHCGYAVWSGKPYIRHIKASDPFVNIVKEAPGYKLNVELYEWAINIHPPLVSKNGVIDTFSELASYFKAANRNGGREYWYKYGEAIHEWLELFEPKPAYGI